jgi:hypothetical protein
MKFYPLSLRRRTAALSLLAAVSFHTALARSGGSSEIPASHTVDDMILIWQGETKTGGSGIPEKLLPESFAT